MPQPRETLIDLNREVEMMSNPDRWPAWPFLPLKRRAEKPGEFPESAYLYDIGVAEQGQTSEEAQLVCRLGNIFTASSADETIQFATFTDLLNEGWRVD